MAYLERPSISYLKGEIIQSFYFNPSDIGKQLEMDATSTEENVRSVRYGALKLLVVGLSSFTLASVTVALRLWARRIKGHCLRFDDYAVLVALVRDTLI